MIGCCLLVLLFVVVDLFVATDAGFGLYFGCS